jgi:hypothetical protein
VSAVVVATGSIVVAALGGFTEAPEKPPPSVRVGEEIDQDLFRTTVVDAVVRTVPQSGSTLGNAGGEQTVLDVTLKVFNNATSSVPTLYLDRSLLRIAPPQGPALVEALPGPGAEANATPSPRSSGPVWRHEIFVPASGVNSRLLPPRLTSTVVVRFPVRDGLTPPERLTIDFGEYELYEDWLTKRTRPELVTDHELKKVVAARVTVPVKREAG